MKMMFPSYAQMELVCRISHLNGIGKKWEKKQQHDKMQ